VSRSAAQWCRNPIGAPPIGVTIRQRLLCRRIITPNGCWEWPGSHTSDGYGQMRIDGKQELVHRVSWKEFKGKIPNKKPNILHKCDNPPCFRPSHLFAGTKWDNSLDCIKKGRMHCGERTHTSKLTNSQVASIRRLYIPYSRIRGRRALARRFSVHKDTIREILKRRTWNR